MIELLHEPITLFITTIITGFGGWFYGRKKANADAEGVQIENYDKGLIYYQKLVDGLGVQLDKAIIALQNSEIEKQEVIKKFTEATHQIHEQNIVIENLTKELGKYKQLNGKSD